MKQLEQAQLLLRKAAQDEAVVDAILSSETIADESVGFHCQQAAEKLLKSLLSARGARLQKTHDLGSLMDTLAELGDPLPADLDGLSALTPFGSVYRYEDFDSALGFDRVEARNLLRALRSWCEARLSGPPLSDPEQRP
jgi:HEPN domain-containing protein